MGQVELQPGLTTNFWGYNGQFPGPLIRVRQGHNSSVHVRNQLSSGPLTPEIDSINPTREVRRIAPGTDVLAVMSVVESDSVVDAVRTMAVGYIRKDAQADDLPAAINPVAVGDVTACPEGSGLRRAEVPAPQQPSAFSAPEVYLPRLVGSGMANKHISLELAISEKTVKVQVSTILGNVNQARRRRLRRWIDLFGSRAAKP